jgi:hypothetical protein
VAIWNRLMERGAWPSYFPTIETAIASGMPVLELVCPACQVVGEVDLRMIDRHRAMTISWLTPSLSCRRCRPNRHSPSCGDCALERHAQERQLLSIASKAPAILAKRSVGSSQHITRQFAGRP